MKKKEICTVIRQKEIGDGIFSMWIQTENIGKEAKPGQFVSLYSKDGSKLLPRPISLCEIDRENSRLRLVYRVTGAKTGTEEFSRLKAGDTIPVIGPLGNGFPVEKAEGKRAFLMGGGIGVPPILEVAKQMQCEKKQIVVGYRNAQTFLKEEFEAAGELYISTEDGSVGTKGNVMDAIREQKLKADIIYACGPTPMLRAIKQYAEENGIECYISLEERMACGIGACLACVCKSKEKDAHSNVNNKRICKDGPVFLSTEMEKSGNCCIRNFWIRRRIFRICGSEPPGSSDHQRCGKCSLERQSYTPCGRSLRRYDECDRSAEPGNRSVL